MIPMPQKYLGEEHETIRRQDLSLSVGLKRLREERNLSQREMAKLFEMTVCQLNRLEAGSNSLKIPICKFFSGCKRLGVTMGELFSLSLSRQKSHMYQWKRMDIPIRERWKFSDALRIIKDKKPEE